MAPYALMPDVQLRVTSDLKQVGNRLLLLPVSSRQRLGGSALAQVLGQLGDEAPDIEEPAALRSVFEAVQDLVKDGAIVACHDVSDGGLIVTLLEMAFAGDKGWRVSLADEGRDDEGRSGDAGDGPGGASGRASGGRQGAAADLYAALFAEEAGVVVEVADEAQTRAILERNGLKGIELGQVQEAKVELSFGAEVVLKDSVRALHTVWEETSYQLERLQQNPECAEQEWLSHKAPAGTRPYRLTFDPDAPVGRRGGAATKPKAVVLREEGTNGDRELAAAFIAAGFEAWDVTMTDLMAGTVSLDDFQLLTFPGGFAFADVLDSAKGWASVIRNHERLAEEFAAFFARPDTLSLGVCNGCQLMGLLGIPGFRATRHSEAPVRQERFRTVRIALLDGVYRQEPGRHAAGHGGFGDGRLRGSWRGPPSRSRPGHSRLDTEERPGAGKVRRPVWAGYYRLSVQPQREPARHSGAVLPRRPSPGHNASPRALLPAAPVAVGATVVELHRESVDAHVPQRLRRGGGALSLLPAIDLPHTFSRCLYGIPYEIMYIDLVRFSVQRTLRAIGRSIDGSGRRASRGGPSLV